MHEFLASETNLSCCDKCGVWQCSTNDLWWIEFSEIGETPFGILAKPLTKELIEKIFNEGWLAICEDCYEEEFEKMYPEKTIAG